MTKLTKEELQRIWENPSEKFEDWYLQYHFTEFKIIFLDNDSFEELTPQLLKKLESRYKRWVRWRKPIRKNSKRIGRFKVTIHENKPASYIKEWRIRSKRKYRKRTSKSKHKKPPSKLSKVYTAKGRKTRKRHTKRKRHNIRQRRSRKSRR